jgi:MFS family permease
VIRRIQDRNIWLVDAAIFLLGLAYGISISVVALFLDARGFTKGQIGELAAWFALGIVALSLPMGALIRRFSARAMLVVALVGYAAAVTVFPFVPSFAGIAAVRFCDGACSVAAWVSCETILLSRTGRENKAFVTSVYAISIACGYVIGPVLAKGIVAVAPMRFAFVVSGAIAIGAALLVLALLDKDVAPEHEAPAEGSAAKAVAVATPATAILARIKTSCFATFAYGYFQASVVLFLPLYLVEVKGVPTESTILVPACFAGGMLLFTNVAGRLGDRYGHLLVMRALGVVGTTMVASFVWLGSFTAMCVAVFVAGATLASISPLSLALQGVVTKPADYSRANAMYNAFYAAGMLLGPPISSRLYAKHGGAAMLNHLAALWVAFIVFTVVFRRDDPASLRGTVREQRV